MKHVLVTGASGFIGGKLSHFLIDADFHVRCQYRRAVPPLHLIDLQARGAELVRIDLAPDEPEDDSSNLAEMMDGIDLVYHIAALTSDWGTKESFYRANVQATINVLDAAEAAGVQQFVYISSLSVHGFGKHRNSTEKGPYYPPTHYYQMTKLQAEEIALSRHCESFPVTVIRPGNVYGPDDTTMMFPIFKAIEKGLMGRISGGKALTPPIYIDDLLDAMMAVCGRKEAYGENFNITGGEKISWRRFLDIAADALGAKRPLISLTGFIALPLSYVLNALWTLFHAKKPPPLTPYRIKQLMNDFHFDISKAVKMLDFHPMIHCTEGLKNTANSYKKRILDKKP